MSKKRKLITSAIFSAVLSLVVAFVFCVTDVFSVRQQTKVQPFFDAEIIAVNENEQNYASLFKNFDKLEVEQEDETQKVVSSVMTMYGSNLDNIQYTSTGQDEEVIITGQTVINKITNAGQVDLVFDFGDFEEYINASSNLYCDEEGNLQGTVLFDGQEYDVQEVLAMMSTQGVQDCWFWFVIKIVFIVVNVVAAANFAVDVFSYLLLAEVTVAGVLLLVVEGLQFLPGGQFAKALSTGFKVAGTTAVKTATTSTGKYLLNKSTDEILDGMLKLKGSEMVAKGSSFANHNKLRDHFNNTLQHKSKYEVHHLVEQRLEWKFGSQKIHNTGNAIRIPKELHTKISTLFTKQTKENKKLFKEITGYDVGNKSIRDYMNSIDDFDKQYEIGIKVVKHFNKGNKYEIDFL